MQKAKSAPALGRFDDETTVTSVTLVTETRRELHWWERMDVWGILMTIFLQVTLFLRLRTERSRENGSDGIVEDGPFFALRIYLIFWRHVISYTMMFFVCKNSLIISVQLYRLMVLCCFVNKASYHLSLLLPSYLGRL